MILEDANVSNTMNQYAISSEVSISFFHLIMAIINMVMVQPSHQQRNHAKNYYDERKDGYYHQELIVVHILWKKS